MKSNNKSMIEEDEEKGCEECNGEGCAECEEDDDEQETNDETE